MDDRVKCCTNYEVDSGNAHITFYRQFWNKRPAITYALKIVTALVVNLDLIHSMRGSAS